MEIEENAHICNINALFHKYFCTNKGIASN